VVPARASRCCVPAVDVLLLTVKTPHPPCVMTLSVMLTLAVALSCHVLLVEGFLVVQWGECPPVKPMENFDVKRYMGKWYASESFDAPYQAFSHCISANYTLQSSTRVRVFNSGYRGIRFGNSLWFKTLSTADGFATIRDSSVPSALNVEFPGSDSGFFGGERSGPNYIVVDTDYDNYALVWSCVPLFGVFRMDTAWILARSSMEPPAMTNNLKAELQAYGINTGYFKKIYQNIC